MPKVTSHLRAPLLSAFRQLKFSSLRASVLQSRSPVVCVAIAAGECLGTGAALADSMERKRKLDVLEGNGAIALPSQPSINPYTGRPYSSRYYDILSKRKGGWWRSLAAAVFWASSYIMMSDWKAQLHIILASEASEAGRFIAKRSKLLQVCTRAQASLVRTQAAAPQAGSGLRMGAIETNVHRSLRSACSRGPQGFRYGRREGTS